MFWCFLKKIADGDNSLHHHSLFQIEKIGDIGIGTPLFVMLPPEDLHPAAAKPKIGGLEVQKYGGNGAVFHPHVRTFGVGADDDGQGAPFIKAEPCCLALNIASMVSLF